MALILTFFFWFRQKCDSGVKKECQDVWKNEQKPYSDQECTNQPQRVCEGVWVENAYNDKSWQEDPTRCQTFSQVNNYISLLFRFYVKLI